MYSDESSEASDGGQDARKKALQTAFACTEPRRRYQDVVSNSASFCSVLQLAAVECKCASTLSIKQRAHVCGGWVVFGAQCTRASCQAAQHGDEHHSLTFALQHLDTSLMAQGSALQELGALTRHSTQVRQQGWTHLISLLLTFSITAARPAA